jgi:hypothetical protein
LVELVAHSHAVLLAFEEPSMMKKKSVFGIYFSRGEAESAVKALRNSGFARSHVSILLPEDAGSHELVTENETKAPGSATIGAALGVLIGGALGWLVGIGALVIPGISPLVAAGPIVVALIGAGVGGALGGFAGALVGVGIPGHEVTRYEAKLAQGGILVAVHCRTAEQLKRAKSLMATSGAEDIASSADSRVQRNAA